MKIDILFALQYFLESLSDLVVHMETCKDDGRTRCEVRVAFPDTENTVVQLWWTNVPSRFANEFLWDSVTVACAERSLLNELLGQLANEGVELAHGHIAPTIGGEVDIPMYQYQPQRFRAVYPPARKVGQMALSGEKPANTMEALQAAMGLQTEAYNHNFTDRPLRFRIKTPQRAVSILAEASMFYGNFVAHGRQIFDIPPALADGFRRSDVEDIPLSAIKLPYESFFLHFGSQMDLETADGWHPDGAYVSMIGDPNGKHVIQFCLTSVPESQETYRNWDISPEPVFIQGVPSELMSIGVGEAVVRIFAEKTNELNAQIMGSKQGDLDQAVNEMRQDFDLPGEFVDVSSQNARTELESLQKKNHAWREMLNLVVNAIAYLSSYEDDVTAEWPAKTPANLLAQLNTGTPKQKQRARSKLAALGFTAIHLCGKRFVEQAQKNEGGESSSKKPTWVRGTWVWQAHGPQWSLRRLQWRMPYVRNKDGDTGEEVGHLYLVS